MDRQVLQKILTQSNVDHTAAILDGYSADPAQHFCLGGFLNSTGAKSFNECAVLDPQRAVQGRIFFFS
jgi:hypothetical protein